MKTRSKTIFRILLTSLALALGACAAKYESLPYEEVSEQTSWSGQNADALAKAAVLSLSQRGWTIDSVSNPIKARLLINGVHAKLRVFVADEKLTFDLSGSMKNGEPYIPKELILYLKASVKENLQNAQKSNP
ncbi:MAG: hypothetical protein J6P03_02010 [Opitutales bacterium]|nr:hypothetical protein [Opitutales bacterium]